MSVRDKRLVGPSQPADLGRIGFLEGVKGEMREKFFAVMGKITLQRRQFVPMSAHFTRKIGFVWAGQCRMIAMSPKGDAATLSSLREGEMFGLASAILNQAPARNLRLVADQDALLLTFDSAIVLNAIDRLPTLRRAAMHWLSRQNLSHCHQIFELSCLSALERVQAELLRLALRSGQTNGQVVISPAPSQAELGERLALSREAVTKQLSALTEAGVIRVQRRMITILDVDRLRYLDAIAVGRDLTALVLTDSIHREAK